MRCTQSPSFGDVLNVPCEDCGHINTLHAGCDCCPVCELLETIQELRGVVQDEKLRPAFQEFVDAVGPWLRGKATIGEAPTVFDRAVLDARSALAAEEPPVVAPPADLKNWLTKETHG